MTSLVEALKPRVERIAISVSRAMALSGAYSGGASWNTYYKYPNRLTGELVQPDLHRVAAGIWLCRV